MRDVKDVILEMIVTATNDIVATSKNPCYTENDLLTSQFYTDTECERKLLDSKIEILAKVIGADDFIYYVHNNSIEFTFSFDDFKRRELVEISKLESYISRF